MCFQKAITLFGSIIQTTMKGLTIVVIISLFFISCEKDYFPLNQGSDNSGFGYFSRFGSTVKQYESFGHIWLQSHDSERDSPLYSISAGFFSNSDYQPCSSAVKIADINVAGSNLSIVNPNDCPTYQLSYDSSFQNYSTYFGNQIRVQLTANPTSGFISKSVSLYSPEQLLISSSPLKEQTNYLGMHSVIKLDEGYMLTWNPDANSQFGKVGIMIWLNSILSNLEDSTLKRDVVINPVQIITDDDGSYFISKNDLQKFPINSYLDINIGRVSHKKMTSNNKAIAIFSISTDTQSVILK